MVATFRFKGGPLDGYEVELHCRSIYRNGEGNTVPASLGDRLLIHGSRRKPKYPGLYYYDGRDTYLWRWSLVHA